MIEKILKKKTKIIYEIKNKLDPVRSLADNKKIKMFTRKKFHTPLTVGVQKCIDSRFEKGL